MKTEDLMMIIPSKFLIAEGTDAPAGTVVVKCKKCGRQFAIPADDANQPEDACCEDCIAAESINEMKSENNDASDTISAALGQ